MIQMAMTEPKEYTLQDSKVYKALNCDDRNFGGPNIWRNFAKTVKFRTSQKMKEFSSSFYVTVDANEISKIF